MKHGELSELAERLCEIGDPALMARLLEEILTPAELAAVIARWTICRLLLEGVSQREISRRLGVSLCKITRGARELKNEDSAIRSLLEGQVLEEPVIEEPAVQGPKAKGAKSGGPKAKGPKAKGPKPKEPAAKEPKPRKRKK